MTSVVRKSLRQAALAIAVGFTLLGMNPVLAQTNVVGSIFGSADAAGGRVVVTSTQTGAVRTATVDSSGRFQITALPPGSYKIELQKDGQTVSTRNVNVVVGAGSEVNFAAAGDAQELDALSVTARAGQFDIDVSQTDTRTVFTAAELEKLTVGRQIEEVALLAPGVVRGDSRYATQKGASTASFGGAASNENAIYINGYAVTDPVKGLGSSSMPFDAIGQMQLLTGGYSAEFGRSTGGVVNLVTKSGTNQWVAGGILTYEPEALRARDPDIYYEEVGSARDGTLWSDRSAREVDSMLYGAYVGGPIIKDKAFFYLSGEIENRTVDGPRQTGNVSGTATTTGPSGWYDREIDVPRWLAKLDWNIMDGHSLALTAISDVNEETRGFRHYYFTDTQIAGASTPADPTDDVIVPAFTRGPSAGGFEYTEGGELYIAKYSGALLDNLVLSALWGTQTNDHTEIPFGYDPGRVPVRDNRNIASPLSFGSITTLRNPDAYDKSEGFRVDLEYLISSHSVRVGYDRQDLEIEDGTSVAGPAGYFWFYDTCTVDPIPNSGGATCPGGSSDTVEKVVTGSGGVFTTDQYAYFVEDRWQVTDNVLLTMGLRNENFENFNSDGVIFLDQTDQWAPRLGASWDVFGDSSLRVFGNAGRYHLAIPLNLAFRQVGGSTNTSEYFAFTSIDGDGIPQGLTPLGDGPFSVNQEYGQARDPDLAASEGLRAYYQDELALGLEGKLMPGLVGGARFIYRELGSQIDDNCDSRPAYNWAVRNGYVSGTDVGDIYGGDPLGVPDPDGDPATDNTNGLDDRAEFIGTQLAHCRIINPGESNKLRLEDGDANGDGIADQDLDQDGVLDDADADGVPDVTLGKFSANISAAEWGLPKMQRDYQGLDLFIEHPFRNSWYGKIDWTISRSEGNAEGQLLSDIGQSDVAVTLNWDHPELMSGANGYLPNDRRHQIKAFGYYQFNSEWRAGATLIALSGRPVSETGFYSGAPAIDVEPSPVNSGTTCDSQCYYENYVDYGGLFYRYTDGAPSPRGAAGRLPWTTTIDVGASYAPNILKNQLKLAVDVFNVFNTVKPQSQLEIYEIGPGTPYHSSGKVISWNQSRAVRFTVRYDWGI